MIDPRQIRKAEGKQIKLPKTELNRLALRIEDDYAPVRRPAVPRQHVRSPAAGRGLGP